MALPNPNRMLVEDTDIKGVVIALMKQRLHWGTKESDWPVAVKGAAGKDNVFRDLPVEIKGSEVKRVGIVVDADSDFSATWIRVSHLFKKLGGDLPAICPKGGLILNIGNQRLGVWIMPNNAAPGMVEHFCHDLVPSHAKPLWNFALRCVNVAKSRHGAPFLANYKSKAHIHTWLAWQSAPGERMGEAITRNVLEHGSDDAEAFVRWFIELFQLREMLLTP